MTKIFINPGHDPNGNPDPGAVNSFTGLRECDVALTIGNLVASYLENAGCQTRLLQSDSLSAVVGSANNWPADFFISIHCNSAADDQAKGSETWYCHDSIDGKSLAQNIQSQLIRSLLVVDRGIKEATPGRNGLYVLTNTDMPACLVETAFISNAYDITLLSDPASQDEFAKAIARGVTDYLAQIQQANK